MSRFPLVLCTDLLSAAAHERHCQIVSHSLLTRAVARWTFGKFPCPHPAHENYTLMGFEHVTRPDVDSGDFMRQMFNEPHAHECCSWVFFTHALF